MFIIGNKSVSLHHKTGKTQVSPPNRLKTNMAKGVTLLDYHDGAV